ncbi:PAS domain S-box protein [Siminovitchia acidinfaciens]|uniref:HTH-type transcriptional regulatory protein TyrR n=1 Tax=Siminovitchia acidinfaciens TaxID=2321395 RepID=A0A429Y899_9BACI|nr:sigma 54-interacting transcriptional regulator [Siminovitchia acidinfaciens]RST77666.1 PAS domain S-box protein [Siminovitchia acidinfaciens]
MLESAKLQQYEDVFNKLPIGVLVIAANGLITVCNQTAAELIGLAVPKIINQPFSGIIPLNKLPSDNTYHEQQILINNKSFSFSAKKDNELQQTICIIHPTEPMTELRDTKLTDLPIEDILNSSQDEIFITDSEGHTLFVNSAGKALYGKKPEDIIGNAVNQLVKKGLFSPSLFPVVKKRNEKVSMIQRTISGKTAHVIANPVFDVDGNMTHIIFTGRDITEIKNLRKKIERSEVLLNAYKSELEKLQGFNTPPETDIVAISPKMRKVLNMANKIAKVDSTILITGESGVGKGVIAKFIHDNSPRKNNPVIHINCGAIPENLMESELFGYESGAFTGADKKGRKGLIEQANGGTLFLDEIGEMPLNLQVKLLKVLQERKFEPVGSSASVKVDIRIIAATNKNLKELINKGTFREDLYYRLNVVPIHIPPLRERPEDVLHLIDFFAEKMKEKYHTSTTFSLEAENALVQYHWPGNVRELENLIERLVVTSENDEITFDDLPEEVRYREANDAIVVVKDIAPLKQVRDEMEKQLIRKAYEVHKSSYKVAELLGIDQSTASRKINKFIK